MSNVTIKVAVIDNSIKGIIELIISKQFKEIKLAIVQTVKEANTVVVCSEDYVYLPKDALKNKQVIILQKENYLLPTSILEEKKYFSFRRELFAEHALYLNMNMTFREAYREEFLEILQMIESRLKE
jgi:hypothetical protein